mmetsp:Transcript_15295/g.50228  ORF Transcript_15295/g.50228 Transcript_15295/m.50228 type:complete len:230 (-) Transcript_15295:2647-3336(-)
MLNIIGACSARAPLTGWSSSRASAASLVRNTVAENRGETCALFALPMLVVRSSCAWPRVESRRVRSDEATSSTKPKPSALVGVTCAICVAFSFVPRRWAPSHLNERMRMYVPPQRNTYSYPSGARGRVRKSNLSLRRMGILLCASYRLCASRVSAPNAPKVRNCSNELKCAAAVLSVPCTCLDRPLLRSKVRRRRRPLPAGMAVSPDPGSTTSKSKSKTPSRPCRTPAS